MQNDTTNIDNMIASLTDRQRQEFALWCAKRAAAWDAAWDAARTAAWDAAGDAQRDAATTAAWAEARAAVWDAATAAERAAQRAELERMLGEVKS
jgi:hypothetical protein